MYDEYEYIVDWVTYVIRTHEYDDELHCSLTREFGVYTTYMTYVIQTHKYKGTYVIQTHKYDDVHM